MLDSVHRWSWKLAAAAAATWVGIHAVAGQHPTHSSYDLLLYVAFGLGVVLWIATWAPVAGRLLWWRKPRLEVVGVNHYFRRGRNSREDNDLQVVYARIRNVRNGGGERATLSDAKAWMTVEDEAGQPLGHGCQGNWVNVFAGTPDPKTFKETTFRPNGEQYGLEVAAKFVWADDAYLAGEVHPNLPPGRYTIRASISDAIHKAAVFEWVVVNPGCNGDLATEGLTPRPPDLEQWARRMTEIATVSAASASQADSSASWGGTALYQEGDSSGMTRLIEEEGLRVSAAEGVGQNSPDLLDLDALRELRRKGLDLLNNSRPGVDSNLLDRAATEWIDDVRGLTESANPGFASYFTIPERPGQPRWKGQSRRMRELVQRLGHLLAPMGFRITYASYGLGDDILDPLERLNARIKDDRINFIVDEATMGGNPAPSGRNTLILRWTWNGEEFQSSFAEGTHVGLPD